MHSREVTGDRDIGCFGPEKRQHPQMFVKNLTKATRWGAVSGGARHSGILDAEGPAMPGLGGHAENRPATAWQHHRYTPRDSISNGGMTEIGRRFTADESQPS